MKILAIDTSSKICSVAILEDENVLICLEKDDEKTHSQKLMPMIDEALTKSNICLAQIQLLASCQGPGSFTGIRIGISTIKAFHDVSNIPMIGVTSLESLANSALMVNSTLPNNSYIVSCIDAKNQNVYYEVFCYQEGELCSVVTANAQSITDVVTILKNYPNTALCFVGDGAVLHKSFLQQELKLTDSQILSACSLPASSISIAMIALQKYQTGTYHTDTLLPIYLRKSQAERHLEGEK